MRHFLQALSLSVAITLLQVSCIHHGPGSGSNVPLPGVGANISPNIAAIVHPNSPVDYQFWDALDQARVIYISETHDDENHHEYQFDILRGLYARGVSFAIGWEMFAYTQQPLLDQWEQDQLSLESLFAHVGWKNSWGKESPTYEKMLRWSFTMKVQNIALNAPESLSKKLAFGETLSDQENAMLPTGFHALPGGFEHFAEQMEENPHTSALTSEGFQNFYHAQTVWDECMAQRVVSFLNSHPKSKLIVLIGRGHVEGGFGVPAYVKQKNNAKQLVLYPGESADSIPSPRLASY